MATDWDKLQKLKRDHPKAKFASKEISRQRKKQPTNPYLLVTTLPFLKYNMTLTLLFQGMAGGCQSRAGHQRLVGHF
jgi:hypothetical protein